MNNNQLANHWNTAYESKPIEGLGWYESHPEPSLQLITALNVANKNIFIPGAGATVLVDRLVNSSAQIFANDISEKALEMMKKRVGDHKNLHYVVGDLRNKETFSTLPSIDIWHDRAVFHFLTEQADRDAYIEQIAQKLHPEGTVHIATFHTTGAEKCSGLPVERYDAEKMEKVFSSRFNLIDSFEHLYHNPAGAPRPYIYATLQLKKEI